MIVTVIPVTPTYRGFGRAAALFEEYRKTYGQSPSPEATQAWLREQLTQERMSLAVAVDDLDQLRGFITTTMMPASLRLGTNWSIRDLYVIPSCRRAGIAGQLLQYAVANARAAGALRVSLQTEIDNAPAVALYAAAGFHPVNGLVLLNLTLVPETTV